MRKKSKGANANYRKDMVIIQKKNKGLSDMTMSQDFEKHIYQLEK